MLRFSWRVVVRFLGYLRRGLSIFVFLLMLAFTIASHTVETVSDVVTSSIEVVTGTTTLLSDAISERNAARQKVSAKKKELKNTRASLKEQKRHVSELKNQNAKLRKAQLIEIDGKRIKPSEAVNNTVQKVQSRTKKVAATNVASTFGEGIPFYGLGVITAATAYEMWGACENMRELQKLQKAMNPGQSSDEAVTEVCGLKVDVPTKQEIWDKVKGSPEAAWDLAADSLEGTSDWAQELDAPDFSGFREATVRWFSNLL